MPSRQGLDRTKGGKKRETTTRGFEKKFAIFLN
jgi:hypothetical protein